MMGILEHALEDGHIIATVNQLLHFPEELEKAVNPSPPRSYGQPDAKGSVPVDVKETSKEYIFYADVPGLTKSDIQVQVEEDKVLVIKSAGKRKREENEEEECKYVRMERRANPKFVRKFSLPGDANVDGISGSCADGVLTVSVPKIPPMVKSKTIEVSVS